MAVTPVYELDIPAPYDTFFVHGEKALSVSPTIDGAAARTNYNLAVWTYLEGGAYFLRMLAVQASSWATAVTQGNYRVIFNTKRDIGPIEFMIELPRGRQRIDLILSNLLTTAGPCFIAFSLHRQGKLVYSSNAVGWVFNVGGITDAEIPQTIPLEQIIPVFTLLPNWKDGITERITYSTEILQSESDFEQRRSLRILPRRTFEASFLRSNDRRTRLDSFLAGQGMNQILLPMWHEAYRLQGTLGVTLTFPTGTLESREFREGGYCIVNSKNPNVYEQLLIASIDLPSDTITFVDPPAATWGKEARIFPVRVARVTDQTTIENLTDAVGTTTIRFQLDDNEPTWFDPSWGTSNQYFRFKPDRATAISASYDRVTSFTIDASFGPLDVYDSEQKSRLGMRGSLWFKGRAEFFKFRRFIDKARGRAISFWIPSFTTDFVLTANPSGTHIDVRSVGFFDYFKSTQHFRLAIIVEFKDGQDPFYSFISDVSELNDSVERIELESSISVDKSTVKRISYLMVVRFDQDTFEVLHEVADSHIVRTSFVVRTTDEDLPLPGQDRAVFTSLIYPLEVVESLDVAATFRSGYTFEPIEPLDVTATLVSGLLEVVIAYESITADPEALDVTSTFLGGTLDTIIAYKTIDADPEKLDVNATLLSATLIVVINYIEYSDPADDEGIDVNATFLGGSLD